MSANGKMAKLSTSVSSMYWKIPFFPQQKQMIADHGIIIKRQSNVENEEDAAIPSKKEVTSHPDYWEIRKIIRLIQIGDPTATVLMLCALKEFDFLQTAFGSEIIRHLNGVSLFLNIIETDDDRCKMAALNVLVTLARSPKSSETILRKKGMQLFVLILRTEKNKTVLSLVCEVITSMAKHGYATRFLKELKVVEILMTVFKDCAKHKRQSENLKLFHSVCYAVWSCCLSGRKEDAIAVSECLGVITRLVRTKDDEQVRPLLGIIEACCDVSYFCRELDGENLVGELISKMKSTEAIKILSLKILYKCAGDERFQKTFMKSNHLQDIVILFEKLQGKRERGNVDFVTGFRVEMLFK
ncbi:outer dynein arm-docking complex subunit 2-like [Xenia sp. Carnegie-2017]|uniref:outer dynein arm-docking complex subunit 2-like n=1 Tax=Xenia sp. Carnegie-2017 TaxID=2897299 RepID=UPI001F044FEC|nr:outer dynein arm-docking complex subunit 2-like [Xenia sp. Carnegie-2017]XP_046859927.1 outer dynein arm-docking complex subunit 2-like [Xenia sp. Carnegie-2017]XP_046859928.1 outer dynein arm-docking complex subunit 2-like [Xenia sp. Carnegie-2017]XP_046859929.1 outer dynein arm-docking complex subunit 2-like [Xenia sp. Carnegie-2017]